MKQIYKEQIKKNNEWIFDKDYEASLVISDDLDSLLSALMLVQYRPNMTIDYFYDYRSGLYKRKGAENNKELIGIDISFQSDLKCISNHCVTLNEDDYINKHDINLNVIDAVSLNNYHHKYNLSTLLLVASLMEHKFDTKFSKWVSLGIDSSYLQHYQNPKYKDNYIGFKYLEILEQMQLWEFLQSHTKEEFLKMCDDGKLNTKICIDDWMDNKLYFSRQDVPISKICKCLKIEYDEKLLEYEWELVEKHKSYSCYTYQKLNKEELSEINSFAITSKNRYCYSTKVLQ